MTIGDNTEAGKISQKAGLISALPIAGIVLLSLLVYLNSLNSPFYLDDYGYVTGNANTEISELSFESLKKAAFGMPGGLRPVANISFALNYFFLGKDVFGYHLVNLLIHMAAAVVIYFLSIKTLTLARFDTGLAPYRLVSFCAALVWAVHPLHTNAVTYIIQRMASLAAFFFLCSLLSYIQARCSLSLKKKLALYCACVVFGVLAVATKENTAFLPLVIVVYELCFIPGPRNAKTRNPLIWLSVLTFTALAVLLFSFKDIAGNFFASGYAKHDFSLYERLLTQPRVLFTYLSLFLLPLQSRLNFVHDMAKSTSLFSPLSTFFALAGIVTLLIMAFWLFVRKEKLFAFSIFWFLVNLVVESSILPLALIFEYRTYLPDVFLSIASCSLLFRLLSNPRTVIPAIAVIVVFFSIVTVMRNYIWSDSLFFWEDVTRKSPNLARGHVGAYFAFKSRGAENEARQALLRAFELEPGNERVMHNLVNEYLGKKQYNKAVQTLTVYLAQKQTALAYIERARAYGLLQQYDKTLEDADAAIRLEPDNAEARLVQGKAYISQGLFAKARSSLAEARKLGLDSALLYASFGEIMINTGELDKAINYFNNAVKKDPNHLSSYYYLGLAYGRRGLLTQSRKALDRFHELEKSMKTLGSHP